MAPHPGPFSIDLLSFQSNFHISLSHHLVIITGTVNKYPDVGKLTSIKFILYI